MPNQDIVFVERCTARGRVRVPTSKSIAHRALICAALCEGGVSTLSGVPVNEDIDATVDVLRALGVELSVRQEADSPDTREVQVRGCGGRWQTQTDAPLGCRESGSTLRFVLPLCLLTDAPRTLTGSTRLLSRPLSDYRPLFEGREWVQGENALRVGGGARPRGRTFTLEGKTSSQFVTGLLHLLPLLEGDSTLCLGQAPESRPYIDMTLAVLRRFGVCGEWRNDKTLFVPGGQTYRPADMTVDGDASGAAFFEALSALGHDVTVENPAGEEIPQGDSVCGALLAEILDEGRARATVSLADCPDLGPVLFSVAAVAAARGKTVVFTHTARLRLKESDRVQAMVEGLSRFGARALTEDKDGGSVTFLPSEPLHIPEGVLQGVNDHRVVMALSVLCAHVGDGRIDDAHAVSKSFPAFFDCLRQIGVGVIKE